MARSAQSTAAKSAGQSTRRKSSTAKKTTASAKQPALAALTLDEELKAYRDMLLIRRFEERAGQMYGMGLIGGFCHLYIGQEAGRRRHADGAEAWRSGDHRLSRPWPYAGPAAWTPRASWPN